MTGRETEDTIVGMGLLYAALILLLWLALALAGRGK
jgi:hypothetical protein